VSALGGYFGARVLIEVGVGLLEREFQRLLFLQPGPLNFLLPHRIAAQDKTPVVFAEGRICRLAVVFSSIDGNRLDFARAPLNAADE
jgi:hypothetical protein